MNPLRQHLQGWLQTVRGHLMSGRASNTSSEEQHARASKQARKEETLSPHWGKARTVVERRAGRKGSHRPPWQKWFISFQIYRNFNFQRDKPLLLQNIQRKDNLRTTAQPTTGITETPKRKKRAVATRHSPWLHYNQCIQEAGKKLKKGTPTAHRTPVSTRLCSLTFGLSAVQLGGPGETISPVSRAAPVVRVHPAMPCLYTQLLLEGTAQGNCLRDPRVPRLWISDGFVQHLLLHPDSGPCHHGTKQGPWGRGGAGRVLRLCVSSVSRSRTSPIPELPDS